MLYELKLSLKDKKLGKLQVFQHIIHILKIKSTMDRKF